MEGTTMGDEPRADQHVERVQESQQRSQEPGFAKSLLGGASEQNPFADQINVIADTPPAAADPGGDDAPTPPPVSPPRDSAE
jgi:hypothetical protein